MGEYNLTVWINFPSGTLEKLIYGGLIKDCELQSYIFKDLKFSKSGDCMLIFYCIIWV